MARPSGGLWRVWVLGRQLSDAITAMRSGESVTDAVEPMEAERGPSGSPKRHDRQLDVVRETARFGGVQHHTPDDVDLLRAAVSTLAHELAEALTAVSGYLQASQQLRRQTTTSLANLDEAISKAVEQIKRAGEVVAKLRSIANP
jgi:hypothetical protein